MQLQRAASRAVGVRRFGGHSHAVEHHGHGEKSALAEAYGHAQAKLWADEHGGRQAWEWPVYGAWAGITLLALASFSRPSTNPNHWARDEAEERLKRREDGQEVAYGVNYAAVRYMKEKGAVSAEEAERLESGEVARSR